MTAATAKSNGGTTSVSSDPSDPDGVTIILYAAGPSAKHIDAACEQHPHAWVWTLNRKTHPRATLHFEVHHPHPLNPCPPTGRLVLSPFHTGPGDRRLMPFPLEHTVKLAKPFYELSHDYMLAYAADLLARGTPIERIVLCGVDCSDKHHLDQSRGIHMWCGWLMAKGVDIVTFPESALFVRRVHPGHEQPCTANPWLYGQPAEKAQAFMRLNGGMTSVSSAP
ncbi:MAG: hypothetical protein ACREIA_10235 [Opitutaceae bacterium]